jgi:nucleoside-diphosphate-sugar epimerase
MRILLTGASGCIGHYIAEALIRQTNHELFLLVRNPAKLQLDVQARPGIQVLQGDMLQVQDLQPLLPTIDQAILTATAWGGERTFEVNVHKTLALMESLHPERCQQVIYFSTASILNRENQLLPEAGQLGIDYIRSKFECYQKLSGLAIAPRITTLFPTLVFGGEEQKPLSHLSGGVPEVVRWIDLIRFLQVEGSFHFTHGRDIAQIVTYLIEHPPTGQTIAERQRVLGSAAVTVDQAIAQICAYLKKPIYVRLSLSPWLINLLIWLFRIQMDPWSYFALQYRHFTHRNPISPATFGLPTHCASVADILKLSGIVAGK